jgi:hypothetical protein
VASRTGGAQSLSAPVEKIHAGQSKKAVREINEETEGRAMTKIIRAEAIAAGTRMRSVQCLLLISLLTAGAIRADDRPQADPFAQPAGSRTVFRDDGLALVQWSHKDGRDSITRLQLNSDQEIDGSSVQNQHGVSTAVEESYSRHGMAAGRVTRNDADQLLTIQRTGITFDDKPGKTRIDWWISDRFAGESGFKHLDFKEWVDTAADHWEKQTSGALAIGDLDNLTDADGNDHDEVIAVTETSDRQLEVRVFNYTFGAIPIVSTVRLSARFAYIQPFWWHFPHTPGVISVAAVDLDGSGKKKIVVVYHANRDSRDLNANFINAIVCDYTVDVNAKSAKITERESVDVSGWAPINAGIEITHGDFLGPTGERKTKDGTIAGRGREQVAVLYHSNLEAKENCEGSEIYIGDMFVSFLDREPVTDTPQLALKAHYQPFSKGSFIPCGDNEPAIWFQGPRRQWLGLASGLFKLDPDKGYTLGRRQVVMSFVMLATDRPALRFPRSYNFVRLMALDVSAPSPGLDGSGRSLPGRWNISNYANVQTNDTDSAIWDMHLAAGNLVGAKLSPPTPLWSLALLTTTNSGSNGKSVATVHRVGFPNGNMAVHNPGYGASVSEEYVGELDSGSNTAVVAVPYDPLGRSMVLGTPIRFTLQNVASTNYILQEPPKHIDYLPQDSRASARGIVNVSVDPNFNIAYTDTSSRDITADSKDTAGRTYGNSEELSMKLSLTYGVSAVMSKSVSVEGKLKFAYGYNEKTESFTKSQQTMQQSVSATTNAEDALSMRLQIIDIYRYPLYGLKDPNKSSYFDVSFPRPALDVRAGGSQFPGTYHPKHQNGNALTYPVLLSAFRPADLGPFSRPGSKAGETVTETAPLTTPALLSWNSNKETASIAWSQSTSAGQTIDWTKTLSASADLTGTYKVTGTGAILGGDLSVSMTTSNSGSNSWGEQTMRTVTAKRNQELVLQKPPGGDSTRSYDFMPLFYVTKDGTLKMASATSFTNGLGATWWQQTYAAPDAALNLPYRFVNVGNAWDFNLQDNAKLVRGARAYLVDRDRVTGEQIPVVGAVPRGKKVVFEARVYNLSLGSWLGRDLSGAEKPVKVRFELQPYDATSGMEFGNRTVIGTVNVAFADGNLSDPAQTTGLPPLGSVQIPPRGIGVALSHVLDTTNLAPADGTRRNYRVYVIVDPENEVRWKRADGSLGEQTHIWHRPQLTIRLKNGPAAGVVLTLELQDAQSKSLEKIEVKSTGAGQAAMTADLLKQLNDSATLKAYSLQAAADPVTSGIIVSHTSGRQKVKASTESRSGVVVDDGTPAGKALYFVPGVSGSPTVTVANTVLVTNDSPAQNKEGYFELAVMQAPQSAAPRLFRSIAQPVAVAAIDGTGSLVEKNVRLRAGQPSSLRVSVNTAENTNEPLLVSLYLGDPNANGTFVGMVSANGANAGTPAHTWQVLPMPNVAGEFPMYAQIAGEVAKPAGLTVRLVQ